MSNFAFGTYRISEHNPQHIQAIQVAIESGVSMIDTSSNYMDGEAERAIALALKGVDKSKIENLEIVSKFGYIQGQNMLAHKENPFEDVVEYSENCYHSIAPSFLHDQLTKSLSRLELSRLDCYLIHNPEYYLLQMIKDGVQRDDRLDGMFARIYEAFVGLEQEVEAGRILSYGISSNSFSKPHNDDEFLPYEDLITLAKDAAFFVGNPDHSFTTIQLPINLLERDGLKCAAWAKKNGLRVLANRPLNATMNNLMYRLADYEEPREYFYYLNELLELCENETLQSLYNLVEELDASKHKFGWIGDYEAFLYGQIIPHIKNVLLKVEEDNREEFLRYIDLFLQEYKKMVLFECSKSTRIQLKDIFKSCEATMQECALEYLQSISDIDYILVGMRKPSYVHELLSFKVAT